MLIMPARIRRSQQQKHRFQFHLSKAQTILALLPLCVMEQSCLLSLSSKLGSGDVRRGSLNRRILSLIGGSSRSRPIHSHQGECISTQPVAAAAPALRCIHLDENGWDEMVAAAAAALRCIHLRLALPP
jgi:hypothetical protein